MTTKTKTSVRVRVEYWCGTTQMTGTAMTYRGAMRLAAKNRNAYSPKFYDGNRELLDDGSGLVYADELEHGRTVYAV
jgi:hypothetical protein